MKVQVSDQIDQLLDLDKLGIGGIVIPGKIKSFDHESDEYEGACNISKDATEEFLTRLSKSVSKLKSEEDSNDMSRIIEMLELQILENTDGVRIASVLLASLIMHHKDRRSGISGIHIIGL